MWRWLRQRSPRGTAPSWPAKYEPSYRKTVSRRHVYSYSTCRYTLLYMLDLKRFPCCEQLELLLEAARKNVGGPTPEELVQTTLRELDAEIRSALNVLSSLYVNDGTAQMNELDMNLREHRRATLENVQQQAQKLRSNENLQECIGELDSLLATLTDLAIEVSLPASWTLYYHNSYTCLVLVLT